MCRLHALHRRLCDVAPASPCAGSTHCTAGFVTVRQQARVQAKCRCMSHVMRGHGHTALVRTACEGPNRCGQSAHTPVRLNKGDAWWTPYTTSSAAVNGER
eukprot:347947-Chlamydomonas_euryale.AAC.2